MAGTGIAAILLIIATVAFSYKGFTSIAFSARYLFAIDSILLRKEYYRLLTAGFLHANWLHLIFNMVSLLAFSSVIENLLGSFPFLLIYFSGLIGGNLLSLFIHRLHGTYTAVGASGAVCGVIFASIALFPGMEIGIFLLPLSIPAWLYGIVYVLVSIYGVRSQKGNIGHDAHLGGALLGMAVAILLQPAALAENYRVILLIAVPAIVFMYIIIARPQLLLIDNFFYKKQQKDFYSVDHRYNAEKISRQKEIDRILDKINARGMGSLSKTEKEKLDEYSKRPGE